MRRLTTCVMLASAHLSGSVPATKRLEGLVVPEWDWNPPYDEICLDVPTVTGRNGTEWTNNSRGLFIARPDGVPPAGGWPVLMTFTIIDFPTQKPCGLDGHTPSAQVPLAETCVAAFGQVCGTQLNQSYYGCRNCTYTHAGFLESHGCTGTSLSQIVGPSESGWPKPLCPQLPPLDAVCEEELSQKCPLGQARQYTDCELCVDQALRNASSGVHCGMAPESTRLLFCAGYVRPPYTELFSPFGSPHAMGMGCSCLNGTTYGCSAPAKNSTHHMPTGAGCTIDMFAGGLWMQRVKQYAIANGIAVLVANTYYLDAWESYPEDWEGGFDPPFFAALDAAMGSSTSPPPLRDLNPKQIAVHGWSGSAQMVSWVIQLHASGQLGGLRIIAGIMAAGGSYACYYTPPQARGVCANCTVGGSTFGDLLQCSNVSKANGQEPLCNYCCMCARCFPALFEIIHCLTRSTLQVLTDSQKTGTRRTRRTTYRTRGPSCIKLKWIPVRTRVPQRTTTTKCSAMVPILS